jgi:uncharacterized caspase-like protein
MNSVVAACRICLLVFLAAFLSGAAGKIVEKRRAAIVIGNSSYQFAPLPNPRNDAKLIAATLTDLGFDVLLFYDVDRLGSKRLKEAIRSQLLEAEVSVLYYAGHAFQHQGRNLLLPVDARTDSVNQLIEDSVRLDDLVGVIADDPIGVKIVILDACRNNPLANKKGLQPGLAYAETGIGQVLIAFATSAGRVAYDGTGANSPYSASLANALQQPDLDIYDIFRRVRGDVREATGGVQIPWVTGSVESELVLRPTVEEATGPAPKDAIEANALRLDEVLWYFIKDGRDPSDFDSFANTFPESPYAKEASEKGRQRLAALSNRGLYVNGALISNSIATESPAKAGDDLDDGDFLFEQSGERALSETLRRWPRVLPQTKEGLGSQTLKCDLAAADPADPQRLVPGVSQEGINLRNALRDCVLDLAAHPESARLQFQLARVLEIWKRYDWATHYYELASGRGYSAATTNLGHLYRLGLGHDKDHVRAFSYFQQAAALGNPRARVNVGAAYMRGQGVAASQQEGVLWYQLAASSGWSQAINSLADAYRRGTGVEQNYAIAAELYEAAASGGYMDALSSLGRAYVSGTGVEKDVERGLAYLLEATMKGNKYAARFAGRVFRDGADGVQRDGDRALHLFELSAERGDSEAYLDLALGYKDGLFSQGKPDLKQAYYFGSLAARFGVASAEKTRNLVAEGLGADIVKRIDADVELFLDQNGL